MELWGLQGRVDYLVLMDVKVNRVEWAGQDHADHLDQLGLLDSGDRSDPPDLQAAREGRVREDCPD